MATGETTVPKLVELGSEVADKAQILLFKQSLPEVVAIPIEDLGTLFILLKHVLIHPSFFLLNPKKSKKPKIQKIEKLRKITKSIIFKRKAKRKILKTVPLTLILLETYPVVLIIVMIYSI